MEMVAGGEAGVAGVRKQRINADVISDRDAGFGVMGKPPDVTGVVLADDDGNAVALVAGVDHGAGDRGRNLGAGSPASAGRLPASKSSGSNSRKSSFFNISASQEQKTLRDGKQKRLLL